MLEVYNLRLVNGQEYTGRSRLGALLQVYPKTAFKDERIIKILAQINHPALPLYLGEARNLAGYVFSQQVGEKITRLNLIEAEEAFLSIKDALDQLSSLSGQIFVHGQIQPSNIIKRGSSFLLANFLQAELTSSPQLYEAEIFSLASSIISSLDVAGSFEDKLREVKIGRPQFYASLARALKIESPMKLNQEWQRPRGLVLLAGLHTQSLQLAKKQLLIAPHLIHPELRVKDIKLVYDFLQIKLFAQRKLRSFLLRQENKLGLLVFKARSQSLVLDSFYFCLEDLGISATPRLILDYIQKIYFVDDKAEEIKELPF